MTDINGYNRRTTDTIISNDLSASVKLGGDEIDLISGSVLINGAPITASGVQNPMITTLDGNLQDINNVKALTVSTIDSDGMIMGALDTEFINPVSCSSLLSVNGGLDIFTSSTYNGSNISGINNITMNNCTAQSFIGVSTPLPTITNTNASAGFTIDPTGFFDIKKVSGMSVVPMFSITDATKINITTTIDMNNNPLINVININGITPAGGVYMTTSDGDIISATVTESSLLSGATFTGSLTIPENTFKISSYHFNLSGNISTNNGDILTLTLYNGGALATINIELTGSTNEFFELEADFSIRTTGGPGVASISTNFDLTYSDAGSTAWRGSRTCVLNNTTFDTTLSNTLDIRAQWSSTSTNNSIQCRQAILTRTF